MYIDYRYSVFYVRECFKFRILEKFKLRPTLIPCISFNILSKKCSHAEEESIKNSWNMIHFSGASATPGISYNYNEFICVRDSNVFDIFLLVLFNIFFIKFISGIDYRHDTRHIFAYKSGQNLILKMICFT